MQFVHDFVGAKNRAGIFQHYHRADGTTLILRMQTLQHVFGGAHHQANVTRLFFILQFWDVENERVRVVPVMKKMQGKVIKMQWYGTVLQKQKTTRQRKPRKTLD